LTAMLLHQSNGTLTDFRRKFVVLAHGSIFSKVGASSKPGAIQFAERYQPLMSFTWHRVTCPIHASTCGITNCRLSASPNDLSSGVDPRRHSFCMRHARPASCRPGYQR
ncbi:hypothetical protein, partial [Burkholderia multivorans]|uniref:hypothetical protein n=1 Tax=Burkholderia multivorans TaxID=87883 RepID=UPI001C2378EB